MGLSWTKIGLHFKSPLRVVVQVLWSSRENKAEKCRNLKQRLDEAQGTIARQESGDPTASGEDPSVRTTNATSGK